MDAWQTIAPELSTQDRIPHISLAVFHEVDAKLLNETVRYFFSHISPFQVFCNSFGTFPGNKKILFLAPVVTDALLGLHSNFHNALDDAGLTAHPMYRPGAWIPHCTLARNLSSDETSENLKKLSDLELRGSYVVEDLELRGSYVVEDVNCCYFRPVKELARFSLRN